MSFTDCMLRQASRGLSPAGAKQGRQPSSTIVGCRAFMNLISNIMQIVPPNAPCRGEVTSQPTAVSSAMPCPEKRRRVLGLRSLVRPASNGAGARNCTVLSGLGQPVFGKNTYDKNFGFCCDFHLDPCVGDGSCRSGGRCRLGTKSVSALFRLSFDHGSEKGWAGARWRCRARRRLYRRRPLFGGYEGIGISMGRGDVGPISSSASRSCTDNHNDRRRTQA